MLKTRRKDLLKSDTKAVHKPGMQTQYKCNNKMKINLSESNHHENSSSMKSRLLQTITSTTINCKQITWYRKGQMKNDVAI